MLRASVASATNDHRLGANEAPPAIISIFLGEQLTDVFDQIAKGGATNSKEKGTLEIGVDTLPVLPTDPGDRNRTSPFAFTGNRFEFRAPGSLQSIAGPMVTINTILAEALDYLATEIESLIADGSEFNVAVQKVLEEVITVHGKVVYNGDGYTEDWQTEAAARGLPNLRTTLDALPELITEDAMELFSRFGVFTHREMHSRFDIALEQYILSVGVEARLTLEIANTVVLPAAIRYQTELATNLASLKAIGAELDTSTLDEVSGVDQGPAHRDRHPSLRTGPRRCGDGARGGPARPDGLPSGDARRTGRRRRARDPGRRRPLAARHLSGDALHPMLYIL